MFCFAMDIFNIRFRHRYQLVSLVGVRLSAAPLYEHGTNNDTQNV